MANRWVYRAPSRIFFRRRRPEYGGGAITVNDARTVPCIVPLTAFDSGDKIRWRAVRTEGGSNLRTIAGQSSISLVVYDQ